MPASRTAERVVDAVWLLLLMAASSLWCVTVWHRLSATFDEPIYLQCGLEQWRSGSYKPLMRLGTMPLAIDLQTLPLYIWERWHAATIDVKRDIDWILPWARAGNLPFWWLLLFYVFRTARSLGGSWAGRVAATLVAAEPVLLGHAALATTDIALTACLMVFAYEFQAGLNEPWPRRVALPGVLYGLAMLAKASALVFAPLCMLAVVFERLWRSPAFSATAAQHWRSRLKVILDGYWDLRRDFANLVGLGFAVTFLYCRSDWTVEPTFVTWAQSLSPGNLHDIMLWTSQHLHIFTNAGEGLVQQIKHNFRGHDCFILGQVHQRAVWYYFPLTLAIKCSLPFLLLPLAIAAIRRQALMNWPCLAAGVLLAYSVQCRVQIGVRFMFPLLALAAAGYGAALTDALRHADRPWKRGMLGVYVTAALLYSGAASVWVWPDAICYTNELWGGTSNGYLCLSDSNYDWGQGLMELREWRDRHAVDVVDVWYFGRDPRADVLPLRRIELQTSETVEETVEDRVRGKCVAVSTTGLYGAYLSRSPYGQAAVEFFKRRQATDRTTTYFIYDFRK